MEAAQLDESIIDEYTATLFEMSKRLYYTSPIWNARDTSLSDRFNRYDIEGAIVHLRMSCELIVIALGILYGVAVETGSEAKIKKSLHQLHMRGLKRLPVCLAGWCLTPSTDEVQQQIRRTLNPNNNLTSIILIEAQEQYIDNFGLFDIYRQCGDALHIGSSSKFSKSYKPNLVDLDALEKAASSLTRIAESHVNYFPDEDTILILAISPDRGGIAGFTRKASEAVYLTGNLPFTGEQFIRKIKNLSGDKNAQAH